MDPTTRFEAEDGILSTGTAGARYLTNVGSGEVFEVNDTALEVFGLAKEGLTLAIIVERMRQAFPEVPPDELHRDAEDVLCQLIEMGLVRVRTAG